MKREDLFYLCATWNSDPYLLETDDDVDEIWDEICENGFHQICQDTDEYEVACAQLDLDVNACYPVFESDNFTCKFGGLIE